jgi:hypothetical protein
LSTAVLLALGAWFVPTSVWPDSDFYQALARGEIHQVNRPFAQRVLHPLSARLLHEAGLPYTAAFVVIAGLALIAFTVTVAVLLPRELPALGVAALLIMPLSVSMFADAYLPDLMFAAATASLLLLLRRFGTSAWTALALVPLFLIRESTLLFAVVWLAVAWRRGLRKVALAVAGASAAGYLVASRIGAEGAPSLHNVSGPLYLVGKVPFNAMKNLFGLPLWTNDVDATWAGCSAWWHVPLPTGLRLGSIDAVGLCPFTATYPLTTLAAWLALFGVAPTVLAVLWWRQRWQPRPMWVQVALWLGAISFVLGPALGAAQVRLVGYAWPAMLVGMPWLLVRARLQIREMVRLLVISACLAWTAAITVASISGFVGLLVAVALAVPFHVVAIRRLSGGQPRQDEAPPGNGKGPLRGSPV